MAVEDGHILNIDGNAGGSKYTKNDTNRVSSGVGRNSLFATTSDDVEEGLTANGGGDRQSLKSGAEGSARSRTASQIEADEAERIRKELPWYRGVTCKDVKDIMPTVIILLVGLLIMIFVIPYAFSSVLKQLAAESRIEAERARLRMINITRANANSTTTMATPTETTMLVT